MSEKLTIIKTLAGLEALTKALDAMTYVAYDTETTGVLKESEIIGFSVAADDSEGFYVILSAWNVETQTLDRYETHEGAKAFLEALKGKELIMHNATFDCAMTFNNFGVQLMPSVHTDTMILGHLLNENRSNGLKELGTTLFGEESRQEQIEMKASVERNGGVLTKDKYELFKADADLMARYGAKDAILTIKLFYVLVEELYAQGLEEFFYTDESMPLLRGPTYDLNTTGLRIDPDKLQALRLSLEAECLEADAFIQKEIAAFVAQKYPGTSAVKTFNINACQQMAWLLFVRLEMEFRTLTKGGRSLCKALELKVPYTKAAKREFIRVVTERKGETWAEAVINPKTGKLGRPKKVGDYWTYMACGKETLGSFAKRHAWIAKLLEYKKAEKLLGTYVKGIQEKVQYNVIRPNFLQHGTTSGRYACRHPNFQNLPRDDKRVKACVVARQGKVFVGADQSQLEPRVFASVSKDKTLLACFESGEDFYSVVGAPIFGVKGCSLFKSDKDSFATKYPQLRDKSKVIALATPYGRTAAQQAASMGIEIDEAQELIDKYFEAYPAVELMMLESHEQVKKTGVVHSLYGRPRRIPEAMNIKKIYGDLPHSELPFAARTLLNLGMNHRVQSSAATIMNRAAIACHAMIARAAHLDPAWLEVKIVLQVHDELILEAPEHLGELAGLLLKNAMETTTTLPGVSLEAKPKIAKNLAELK